MSISLEIYHHNVWAIQKEIKDAYLKRYATCPQGMSKKKRKDAYPKKVCLMPPRHDKKKKKKKI